MSTEPKAPPSNDDASRQEQDKDDATSQHESKHDVFFWAFDDALTLAFGMLKNLPTTPPIHPNVTAADIENACSLICTISDAFAGSRENLDNLGHAVKGIAIARNKAPNPKIDADDKRFYLRQFARALANYYRFPEGDPMRRIWFKGWSAYFAKYDPAFAKLDDALVEKVCKEINFKLKGAGAKGWIRAAATIAVSVGAFGSIVRGKTEEDCIKTLDNSLGVLWTTRDRERFPEPHLPQIASRR